MLLSYLIGQRYYPIAYPLTAMAKYLVLALALFAAMTLLKDYVSIVVSLLVNTLLIGVFMLYILKKEKFRIKK